MPIRMFLAALLVLLSLVPASHAQTQNQAGFNELLIFGLGVASTSPVTVQVPIQHVGNSIPFSLDALPGNPFVLATANGHLTGWVPVGPGNTVDIDPFSMTFLLDGTGILVPANPLTGLWTTGATGQLSFSLPNLLGAVQDAYQVGFIGPGYSAGLQMSAGFEVLLPVPPFHACPGVVNGTPLAPLSDDGSLLLPITSPGGFTFYGVTYTEVHVNMNGNLTFGVGDPDFSTSEGEMLSGAPRIAVWDDWAPQDANQGTVDAWEDTLLGELHVEFFDVRHFGTTSCGGGVDTNTFCFSLDLGAGAGP